MYTYTCTYTYVQSCRQRQVRTQVQIETGPVNQQGVEFGGRVRWPRLKRPNPNPILKDYLDLLTQMGLGEGLGLVTDPSD